MKRKAANENRNKLAKKMASASRAGEISAIRRKQLKENIMKISMAQYDVKVAKNG
jgi:hypothetical protein